VVFLLKHHLLANGVGGKISKGTVTKQRGNERDEWLFFLNENDKKTLPTEQDEDRRGKGDKTGRMPRSPGASNPPGQKQKGGNSVHKRRIKKTGRKKAEKEERGYDSRAVDGHGGKNEETGDFLLKDRNLERS